MPLKEERRFILGGIQLAFPEKRHLNSPTAVQKATASEKAEGSSSFWPHYRYQSHPQSGQRETTNRFLALKPLKQICACLKKMRRTPKMDFDLLGRLVERLDSEYTSFLYSILVALPQKTGKKALITGGPSPIWGAPPAPGPPPSAPSPPRATDAKGDAADLAPPAAWSSSAWRASWLQRCSGLCSGQVEKADFRSSFLVETGPY